MLRRLSGLINGSLHGMVAAMKTTIDASGRIVVPKAIREAAGFEAGQELEISEHEGRVEIEVASKPMRLVERDGFLAAEVDDDEAPSLTAEEVRSLLERVRR